MSKGKFSADQLAAELDRLTPKDALELASIESDEALQTFFREVVGGIEYIDYAGDFTVNEYRAAVRMAMHELWGFERAGERAGAGWRSDDFSATTVTWVAQQPAYVKLRTNLAAAFDDQATPRPYRDYVDSPREQQRIYQAQRHLALHAADPKTRELAARALGEKMHPTLRVQHEVKRVIHMDERTARLIDETLKMVQEKRSAAEIRASPGDSGLHRGQVEVAEGGGGRQPLLLRAGHPETEPSN